VSWYKRYASRDGDEASFLLTHTDKPLIALRALAVRTREVERLTALAVEDCLIEGVRWAEIGEALGISRQAAQQRFRSKVAEGLASKGGSGRQKGKSSRAPGGRP
jgi:hypothetical protein